MEKAEAIKKIRQMSLPKETMEALETLIPELKDSEDERIRRVMIEHFRSKTKETWCGLSVANIIAWLEKQKPNIKLIQRSWYMEGYHDREFGKEPKWILKTGEGGPKHELNPKYGQPLTGQQVTEEQLHNLNEAIKSLRMDGCEKMADSLHSLYDILKTQRAEPADEQIPPLEGLDAIKAKYYDDGFKNGFDEGVESIKPAEWGEEEEKMLNLTKMQLRILQSHLNYTHGENMADTEYSSQLLQIEK